MDRYLIFEDGTTYKGKAFGADTECIGEVVFTTAMSGYQEVITDQSSNGQIINFTTPVIGNYGINKKFNESEKPTLRGVLVREFTEVPGNYQSETTLNEFLKNSEVPGISEIDTRAITRKLRDSGSLKAAIVNSPDSELVKEISSWEFDEAELEKSFKRKVQVFEGLKEHVVVLDFGIKHGLIANLNKRGLKVTIVPGNFDFEKIKELNPDGILLSTGPGNPELHADSVLETIRELQKNYPLFGIGMGHQLFALANGAKTEKIKNNHKGFNLPVKDVKSGKIYFTAQNHSFTVNKDSISGIPLEVTQVALTDKTVEGLKHKEYPARSVQFDPGGNPGPHDADFIIDEFVKMITKA